MRSKFDEELHKLTEQLVIAANSANEAVHKAIKALKEKDKELAREIVIADERINIMSIEIEQEAYRLISLQQPVTRDLRHIFTILLASSDIERLADHARDIAKSVIRRADNSERLVKIEETLTEMALIVTEMLSGAIEAFIYIDETAARSVALRDEEVDALLKRSYKEIPRAIESNDEVVTVSIGYLGVANNLERIGDYITNICERIVFMSSGDIVDLND